MKKLLFLMLGFPGAGKTTASRMICEQTGAVHVWADDERRKMFDKPVHSQEENRKLYDHLNREVDKLLAKGKSVVFDSNFNFYKDREKMRRLAATHGAQTVVAWINTPHEISRQRAVCGSGSKTIRLWGNMPPNQFDRMSRNLQPPRGNESVIKLNGTNFTDQDIAKALRNLTS